MSPSYHQILLAGLLAAACRAAAPRVEAPTPRAAVGDSACTIAAPPAPARDTVTIALTEPIDPSHAPIPHNDAERLVFRQLYQTLVGVDCDGRIVPGLASSWSVDDAGRRWTFTLRDDARFWDGSPVTARDVLASWIARDSGAAVMTWPGGLAHAATVTGERAFTVLLPPSYDSLPPLVADAALAVSKPAPDRGWPIGTGPFWVTTQTASARLITATPMAGDPYLPALAFRVFPVTDARDALDEGVDLLVTSDPAVLDYAGSRPELASVPLEWDRTYVLLAPAAVSLTSADLDDLRRAVQVDARAAERFFWWWSLTGCHLTASCDASPDGPAPAPRRIVYDRTDPTARDLAARLVARSLVGHGTVAAGLVPEAFAAALDGGNDAYVLAFRRRALDRCRLAEQIPPLVRGSRTAVIPLVDARSHAILRRGLGRVGVDFDGTLRLVAR